MNRPNKIGVPPSKSVHRQLSAVMNQTQVTIANNKMPTLAAVPIAPARNGREMFGQASETNAIPFGHIPPIPMQVRNLRINNWLGDCAIAQRNEKTE
jgi:hypothetical protein